MVVDATKLVNVSIGAKPVTKREAAAGWKQLNVIFTKQGDFGATLAVLQKPDLLSNLLPARGRKKQIASVFAALDVLSSDDKASWPAALKCVRENCDAVGLTLLNAELGVEKAFEVLAYDVIANNNRDSLSEAFSLVLGLQKEERRFYSLNLMREHLGLGHTLDFVVQRATDPGNEDSISFRQAQSLILAILKNPELATDSKTGKKVNWLVSLSTLCITAKFMLKPKFSESDPQKTTRLIAGELFEQLGGLFLLREQGKIALGCFDCAHDLFMSISDVNGMNRVDEVRGPLKRQSLK